MGHRPNRQTGAAGDPSLATTIVVRESLGDIIAACELREGSRVGIPGRPHHYRSVLRDQIGNVWTCKHEHADQDLSLIHI